MGIKALTIFGSKNFLVQYFNSVTLCWTSTEKIRQKVGLYV